jgi:hypothetical protein
MRVEVDVELGRRTYVALADCPAHDYNFLYFLLHLWELPKQETKVSQSPCVSPNNFVRAFHNDIFNSFELILLDRFLRRFRNFNTSKSSFSMHLLCIFFVAKHQFLRTSDHRHIISAYIMQDIQCILGGVIETGIACRCGETYEIKLLMLA